MLGIISIVVSVYLITLALVNNTTNLISAIVFKVVPFFLGLGSLYVGLVLLGVLNQQ